MNKKRSFILHKALKIKVFSCKLRRVYNTLRKKDKLTPDLIIIAFEEALFDKKHFDVFSDCMHVIVADSLNETSLFLSLDLLDDGCVDKKAFYEQAANYIYAFEQTVKRLKYTCFHYYRIHGLCSDLQEAARKGCFDSLDLKQYFIGVNFR